MPEARRFSPIGHVHEDLEAAIVAATQLPVGSIFFTADNTNPGTLLGYGTWELRASGQALIGA